MIIAPLPTMIATPTHPRMNSQSAAATSGSVWKNSPTHSTRDPSYPADARSDRPRCGAPTVVLTRDNRQPATPPKIPSNARVQVLADQCFELLLVQWACVAIADDPVGVDQQGGGHPDVFDFPV